MSAAGVPAPSLRQLPHTGFPVFVVEQLLRGLMLAPLDPNVFYSTDLRREIRYVLSVSTSPEDQRDEFPAIVEQLRELGFEEDEL